MTPYLSIMLEDGSVTLIERPILAHSPTGGEGPGQSPGKNKTHTSPHYGQTLSFMNAPSVFVWLQSWLQLDTVGRRGGGYRMKGHNKYGVRPCTNLMSVPLSV